MADKKITDLTLISSVTSDVNIPGDNGTATYRLTAAQLKAFILANDSIIQSMIADGAIGSAELAEGFVDGLTSATASPTDYMAIADTSDSNKKKKALISDITNSVFRSVITTDAVGASDGTMALSGSSFTATLPTAVGKTGKRYKFIHRGTNGGANKYTIATTSSQTIGENSATSFVIAFKGELLEVESDGSNWMIVNYYASMYKQVVSGVTGVNFKVDQAGSDGKFVIDIIGMTFNTDNSTPDLLVSTDGGSTFITASASYMWESGANDSSAGNKFQMSSSSTAMRPTGTTGTDNGTGAACNGTITIWQPSSTSQHTYITWNLQFVDNTGSWLYGWLGSGRYLATTAVTDVRLAAQSTHTMAGTFVAHAEKTI